MAALPLVISIQPLAATISNLSAPHTTMAPSAVTDMSVPKPSMTVSSADKVGTKRKIICFSDFDGTIFMQDTGHVLFDSHGCGAERREVLDQQIKTGERSFKEVSEEMWGSLNVRTKY